MIWIRKNCALGYFIVANNIRYFFCLHLIILTKWYSHLLEEIFNLNRSKSCLHEFINFWKNVLFPIFEQFVLFHLRRLTFQQIGWFWIVINCEWFLYFLFFHVFKTLITLFIWNKANNIWGNFIIVQVKNLKDL